MSNLRLLYGEEDFLIDEYVRRLRSELPGGASDLNYEALDGKKASADVVIASLSSAPMFGGAKLVVVSDHRGLAAAGRAGKGEPAGGEDGGDGKDDLSRLTGVLAALPTDVHAVFVVRGGVDKRKKMFRFFERSGEVIEFRPFAEWEEEKLLSWIIARVKAQGKSIMSHAARRLAEISGPNLRALALEIDKIVTYVGEKASIEEADVIAIASRGSISIFSLVEALRQRDTRTALACLARLFRDKEDPSSLLGLMAKQFRMFLQIRGLREKGLSLEEISVRLKANYYFLKRTAEGARNFSITELRRNLEILHRTDLELKTTSVVPQSALELAIINLCS